MWFLWQVLPVQILCRETLQEMFCGKTATVSQHYRARQKSELLKFFAVLSAIVCYLKFYNFIIFAKEVMFLPVFVCLSVCLSVSKITQKVMDGSF